MQNITKGVSNTLAIFRLDNISISNPYFVLEFVDKVSTNSVVISLQDTSTSTGYHSFTFVEGTDISLSAGQGELNIYESSVSTVDTTGLTLLQTEEYESIGTDPSVSRVVYQGSDIQYLSYGDVTALEYISIANLGTDEDWMNTGIVPTINTRVVMRFRLFDSQGIINSIFGVNMTSEDAFIFGAFGGYWSYAIGSSILTDGQTSTSIDESFHTVEMSTSYLKLDGKTFSTFTTTSLNITGSIVLFGIRSASDDVNSVDCVEMQSCQIYEANTLVRNFKPQSNGTILDTVKNVTYYNRDIENELFTVKLK